MRMNESVSTSKGLPEVPDGIKRILKWYLKPGSKRAEDGTQVSKYKLLYYSDLCKIQTNSDFLGGP